MIVAFIFAFLTGAFSVLLVQAFLLYKWWSSKERAAPVHVIQQSKVTNPKIVAEFLKSEGATEKESCMFLNLLLSFLWQEWRDSTTTKQYFMRKMNMEFSDLMHNRTAGRLIEKITILDLNLGNTLPVFNGVTIMKADTKDPEKVPGELNIAFDLEYDGGCHMAIQVDFPFNKSAYFSVVLVSLKGRAQLQFCRNPCTHWSVSFYEEPDVHFDAESHVEGKNIEQLTTLIVNHLRRTINKKHTLPNYKMRYLPFFPKLKPQDEKQEIYVHNSLITIGQLEVKVHGCSRLAEIGTSLYCALSVDALPWKHLAENSRALWTTFEVELMRDSTTASFGMTLSKEYGGADIDKVVFVETIVPASPADVAGLRRGDVLISVEGQRIESLKQAAKLIKNKTICPATFQRPPSKNQNRSDSPDGFDERAVNFKNVAVDSEESDSAEEFVNIMIPLIGENGADEATNSVMRDLFNKSTELHHRSRQKRKRLSSRPTNSSPETKRHPKANSGNIRGRRAMTVSTDGRPDLKSSETNQRALSPGGRGAGNKPTKPSDEGITKFMVIKPSTYCERPGTKKTKEVPTSQDPVWDENIQFDIGPKDVYLNICIWSKLQEKNEKDFLIGHITVPLMDIIVQCMAVEARHHQQSYVLVSPHIDRIILSKPYLRGVPGLNESLCGGDLKLSFIHSPSLLECDDSSVLEKLQEIEKLKAEEEESEVDDSFESSKPMEHNFILTQFFFPTRCNYCSKKIWTKVAFQCRICALICHKKCLDSCRRFSSCLRSSGKKSRWFSKKPADSKEQESPPPEPTTPEPKAQDTLENSSTTPKTDENESSTASKEIENDTGKLENEKSKEQNGDTSLPEKPAVVEKSDDSAEQDPLVQEIGEAVASDMVSASEQVKEIGRELFSNLPPEARKKKLQDMMARLQVEIDEENETQADLYITKKRTKDKKLKAHFISLISKSEERSQALAMLMLQYCAGLQDCADAEDEGCYAL